MTTTKIIAELRRSATQNVRPSMVTLSNDAFWAVRTWMWNYERLTDLSTDDIRSLLLLVAEALEAGK